jgi:hypothetical protein
MTKGLETDLRERLQALLEGRTVKSVRLTDTELYIEFTDGRRLFADGGLDGKLELSVN